MLFGIPTRLIKTLLCDILLNPISGLSQNPHGVGVTVSAGNTLRTLRVAVASFVNAGVLL